MALIFIKNRQKKREEATKETFKRIINSEEATRVPLSALEGDDIEEAPKRKDPHPPMGNMNIIVNKPNEEKGTSNNENGPLLL